MEIFIFNRYIDNFNENDTTFDYKVAEQAEQPIFKCLKSFFMKIKLINRMFEYIYFICNAYE